MNCACDSGVLMRGPNVGYSVYNRTGIEPQVRRLQPLKAAHHERRADDEHC